MSQRRALIASILLTLVLALSAIGIRTAMTDTSSEDAAAKSPLPVLVTGGQEPRGDDDTTYDDGHDNGGEDDDSRTYASSQENDDHGTLGTISHEGDDDD